MRDLEVINIGHMAGHKEFNHLRISNIDEFFENYNNNQDYYKSPFAILAELEKQIMFENNPPKHILIDYKPDGSIIFELIKVYETFPNLRIVAYSYNGSVS